MKGFLKLKLVLTLSALIMIMAAVAIPLSGSLIRTHAQAPHNQVVIFLQGLNSKLTLDQVRDQTKSGHSAASIVGMGQIPTTISSALSSNAQFYEFSYLGSGPRTGNPIVYDCQDTFSQPIVNDILLLQQQIFRIVATEPKGTETDIYLIGHSLGGAVAFGYATFLDRQLVTPLPSGLHLKAVITLDAPLGGVQDSFTNSFIVRKVYEKSCNLHGIPFRSLSNLTRVLDSTVAPFHTTPPDDSDSGPDPLGAQASVLMLSNPPPHPNKVIPSNEDLAGHADLDLGTSFLAIGNVNDFVWKANACNSQLPNTVDTQWLEDEGADLPAFYGRSFASKISTCPSLNSPQLADVVNDTHRAVLFSGDVQTGITNFLTPTVGGIPTPLTPVTGPE